MAKGQVRQLAANGALFAAGIWDAPSFPPTMDGSPYLLPSSGCGFSDEGRRIGPVRRAVQHRDADVRRNGRRHPNRGTVRGGGHRAIVHGTGGHHRGPSASRYRRFPFLRRARLWSSRAARRCKSVRDLALIIPLHPHQHNGCAAGGLRENRPRQGLGAGDRDLQACVPQCAHLDADRRGAARRCRVNEAVFALPGPAISSSWRCYGGTTR